MSYYFNDELFLKVKSLISENDKRELSNASYVAKGMLSGMNLETLKVENGTLSISRESREYNRYDEEDCKAVETELKAEIKELFGVEAEVTFAITHTEEEEPEITPPLYWGGTDTVYYYKLSIEIKV